MAKMLNRNGFLGYECECCGEPATKGQNRAREKREWMTAEENADRIREVPKRFETEADIDSFNARWF